MPKTKCTLKVKYNKDTLLYGDNKWWLYNGIFLTELKLTEVGGLLAYRIKGGKKLYYRSKMEKLVKKCNIEVENEMPF